MTFRAARCPSCSGDLQVPDDRDTVRCMYCGGQVVVREAIQAAAGGSLKNWLVLAKAASESGNNPEAYDYYTRVLEVDPSNSEAWAGKAEAAGWMSTLSSFRLPEMLGGFQKSIEYSSPQTQGEAKRVAAEMITNIIAAYYKIARAHLLEFIALDNTWQEYLSQCELMMTGLETARSYWPENEYIVDYLIFIHRDNIHGVKYSDPYAVNGPLPRVATLSPEYEATLRSRLDFYIAKKRELDPTYQPEPITKAKASPCFIATATMGTADHPTVILLKEFRDIWLMQRRLGRTFVAHYYRHSPRMAAIIEKSRGLRFLSYLVIVLPSAWLGGRLLGK